MDRNAKKVLVGVGLLATGVAIALALVKLLQHADMVCAKYGLIDWEEDECECCNGDGNCHCEHECACDSGNMT